MSFLVKTKRGVSMVCRVDETNTPLPKPSGTFSELADGPRLCKIATTESYVSDEAYPLNCMIPWLISP